MREPEESFDIRRRINARTADGTPVEARPSSASRRALGVLQAICVQEGQLGDSNSNSSIQIIETRPPERSVPAAFWRYKPQPQGQHR